MTMMFVSYMIFASEFGSVNYYSKHYLFDAQIYSVNTLVSENSFSYEINDFTPHLNYIQYQGLDKYQESDFGLGSEYKLTDKLTLDVGSWYYYYYDMGDHYFEPYILLNYDWLLSPTFYVSMITYNYTPRATFSLEYNKSLSEEIKLTIRPIIGTADYDIRYGYYGVVVNLDYNINKYFTLFTTTEIDKPFSSPDNNIVYTYSFGLKTSL